MKSIGVRFLWFAFGVCIGVLVMVYGNALLQPEPPVIAAKRNSFETDAHQLISLRGDADAVSRRKALVEFVWGPHGFPSNLPHEIEEDVGDERFSRLGNLKQINRLTIFMEWGLTSTAYHFLPIQGNNKLLIYHHGHNGDFVGGIRTIGFFLQRGFSVIALSMPLETPNNQPIVEIDRLGKIQLTFHEQLKLLEMKSGHPVQLFLTPVAVSLNYAKKFGYKFIYMTGVSGGGWTTTMCAAIDPRINGSYPVAGSLPLHLRSNAKLLNTAQRAADWGDYEQTIPELYRIANYLELYILGSSGNQRRQIQVLNKYDPCCFAGDDARSYEDAIKASIQMLGQGGFSVYLDTSHRLHDISAQALAVLLADTEKDERLSQK